MFKKIKKLRLLLLLVIAVLLIAWLVFELTIDSVKGKVSVVKKIYYQIERVIIPIKPAVDLAVCIAIASALKNKAIAPETIVLGEVGLGGEIRSVSTLDKRLAEAAKLGFHDVVMPAIRDTNISAGLQIIPESSVGDAIRNIVM